MDLLINVNLRSCTPRDSSVGRPNLRSGDFFFFGGGKKNTPDDMADISIDRSFN